MRWPEELARRYRERGDWRDNTIGEQVHAAIARSGDNETFVFGGERVTYRELGARSTAFRCVSPMPGLKPLDRVVLQPPNGAVESMETNEKAAA